MYKYLKSQGYCRSLL